MDFLKATNVPNMNVEKIVEMNKIFFFSWHPSIVCANMSQKKSFLGCRQTIAWQNRVPTFYAAQK